MVVMIHAYNIDEYSIPYKGGNCIALAIEDTVSQGIVHLAVPVFFFISVFLFLIIWKKAALQRRSEKE